MQSAMLISSCTGFIPQKVVSWEYLPARDGRQQRIAVVVDEKLPPLGEVVMLVTSHGGAMQTRVIGQVKLLYSLRAKDGALRAFVVQVSQAALGGIGLGAGRLASPTLQLMKN